MRRTIQAISIRGSPPVLARTSGWRDSFKRPESGRGGFFRRGFLLSGGGVFLAEFLDATGSIEDLLLAGLKGMACGADFDVDLLAHG